MNVRSTLAVAGLTLLGLAPITHAIAAPAPLHVLVTQLDGQTVAGELLQLTPEGIRIDPDGPVSFRFIPASDIRVVLVRETNLTLSYPLAPDAIPASMRRDLARTSQVSDRAAQIRTRGDGFGWLTLSGNLGVATTGFTPEEKAYYQGFGSGPTWELGVRVFFPRDGPREGRLFLGAMYGTARPHNDYASVMAVDTYGNLIAVAFSPLEIRRVGGVIGYTTRMMGTGSYLAGTFGLMQLKHTLTATAAPFGGGSGQSVVATYTEAREAIRIGLEGVVGIAAHLGIEFAGTLDALYAGQEAAPLGYSAMSTPKSDGALLGVTVGVRWSP